MKNEFRGFTLTELITAVVITSIIIFAITVFFVAEYKFCATTKNKIATIGEARIAMNHLTETLRFAENLDDETDDQITAVVNGVSITYRRLDDGTVNPEHKDVIEYTRGANTIEIAENITFFACVWDNPYLGIWLTSDREGRPVSLRTQIRVLGRQE